MNRIVIVAIFLETFFNCWQCSSTAIEKPKLKILMTSPKTGHTTAAGRPCLAAATIALEAAQNDPTFLPSYQIEFHYENDGYAIYQPRAVINYTSQYSKENNNNTFAMPIGVGFLHSYGVLRIGHILPHVGLNIISVGGQTVQMAGFENVFKTRAEIEPYIDAVVDFMIHFQWRQVALLAAYDSPLGFRLSKHFISKAELNNISIVWYETVSQMDHHYAEQLLKSDARIIFLPHLATPIANNLLCQLYNFGITGYRFQFVALNTVAYFDENDIPAMEHCSNEQLLVQYRQTIFVGSKPFSSDLENTTISRFGYNVSQFNEKFHNRIKGIIPTDIAYICHCHDGMLHALLALEKSELELNQRNLSLKNVYDSESKVFETVHRHLKTTIYRGIRMSTVEFNPMDPNKEPMVIQKLTESNIWTFPFRSFHGRIEQLETIQWPNGKVPKDRPKTIEKFETLSLPISIAITTIQCIVFLFHFLLILIFWRHRSFIFGTIEGLVENQNYRKSCHVSPWKTSIYEPRTIFNIGKRQRIIISPPEASRKTSSVAQYPRRKTILVNKFSSFFKRLKRFSNWPFTYPYFMVFYW